MPGRALIRVTNDFSLADLLGSTSTEQLEPSSGGSWYVSLPGSKPCGVEGMKVRGREVETVRLPCLLWELVSVGTVQFEFLAVCSSQKVGLWVEAEVSRQRHGSDNLEEREGEREGREAGR